MEIQIDTYSDDTTVQYVQRIYSIEPDMLLYSVALKTFCKAGFFSYEIGRGLTKVEY